MPERVPTSAVNITETWADDVLQHGDPTNVIPWDEVRDRIARASDYWAATVRASGAPHVRPVFAVWVDGHPVSTNNGSRAKARNLESNPPCLVHDARRRRRRDRRGALRIRHR
jgi:hypothetical protein